MTALKLVEPEEVEIEVAEEGEHEGEGYEFDKAFQTKIMALFIRDTVFATRTDGLIEPSYFETSADGIIAKMTLDYYRTYKKAPDKSLWTTLIKDAIASKKLRRDDALEVRDRIKELMRTSVSDREFVISKVASFAKNRAVEAAILKSVELLSKGAFDDIGTLMKIALTVGAMNESSTYNYWEEIENRTAERKEIASGMRKKEGITTGYADLDKYLYHGGWGRKELSVVLGAAKAGKSMSLGEFAKNASLAGYDVLYITLEVAAKIIAERTDANVASVAMNDLGMKIMEVDAKIKAKRDAGEIGLLNFEEFPSGTFTPSQMRRLIEHHRAKGFVYDLIVVDYADIMAPDRKHNETRDEFREIYLELRAIAFENNCAVLSATQTNREGAKAAVAKATDIAEDFNKVRTADILLSINATEDERKAGEGRIYFAAVRNGESGFSLRIRQDRAKMQFITKVIGRE